MRTINIKNVKPCIFSDYVRKKSLFIEFKHNKKDYWLEFNKKDLNDYFKNHLKTFDNLVWFLNFEIFQKQWYNINWDLFFTNFFIMNLKKNYNQSKNKLKLPDLI